MSVDGTRHFLAGPGEAPLDVAQASQALACALARGMGSSGLTVRWCACRYQRLCARLAGSLSLTTAPYTGL
eukprot:340518-Rhodomonas_salina.3